jgi:hypothetical protein
VDNLDRYDSFYSLPKDAKERVRARAAAMRVDANPVDEAAVSRRVAAATDFVIDGKAPSPAVVAVADQTEAEWNQNENWVEAWFQNAGRRFLPLLLLYAADDTIRATMAKAQRWPITGTNTPEVVMERIKHKVRCDLDIYANAETGPCLDQHIDMLAMWDRCDGIGKDGLPHALRRKYIEEHFSTVPFAFGDSIAFARICDRCWAAWLAWNHINTKEIGFVEPIQDGFGSVAPGGIKPNEYVCSLIDQENEIEPESPT